MGMRIKLHSTNHPNNLLKELNKCRLSETMSVLACAAGYFQNLFLNTGLDAARTYVVDFITPANFEKILSFVYTSELFTDLINVGVIYEVAERLGMEDLLQACHSTFPDLESSAIPKQPSLAVGEGRSGPLSSASSEQNHSLGEIRSGGEHFGPERGYLLHGEAVGGYKEDDRNNTSEGGQALALMQQQQQPPKTEQEPDVEQFAPAASMAAQPSLGSVNVVVQTTTSSCQQYKVQSNGDYSKGGFFTTDASLDISTGSNSCPSNSNHSKEQGFVQMDELQLEDLGEDELHFEDASEELGPSEEVIELSDDSEEELAFENDSRDSKAMPCQVCKKVLEPNIQLIRQHARDHVDLLTGNCKVCETHFQDRNSRVTHVLSHIGIFLFSCDMCETKFFTQWQLTLHRREGVHLSLCSLMWHALSHLGISVFSCSVCANSFVDRHLLEKHLAVHQNLPEEFLSEDLALQSQPGNSKYSCKVCGKRFAHTSEFNYHRRIHTGEKPYQCKVCHKFFRGRSTIKCHLRTHSGALMYRCTVCGHYSSTLNLMSKHIGVHKGSLPPDFTIEQTFMYIIHSKDAEKNADS
uniref:Zinc finger and BTB domain containing 39 n=1 Tax=Anas platyrhynchos TaxID=8839 RepID=A0A8B9T0K3_ANAPL